VSNRHPVWSVYDELRTVSLNEKYYSKRIVYFERINFWLEIIIAVSASSAIAKFTIFRTETGSIIWSLIAGIAVILAVIKPFMKLTDRIRKIENVLTKYRLLKHEFGILRIDITEKSCYNDDHKKIFRDLLTKESELIEKQPENYTSKRLINICSQDVNKEYPVASFFIPKE
jgi:hypothetical protein